MILDCFLSYFTISKRGYHTKNFTPSSPNPFYEKKQVLPLYSSSPRVLLIISNLEEKSLHRFPTKYLYLVLNQSFLRYSEYPFL